MADIQRRLRRIRRFNPDPRLFRDRFNPLEVLAVSEVRERYRFVPETIMFLVGNVLNLLESATNRSSPLPPLLTLLVTLNFYATGAHFIVIADIHGVSKASVCRAVRRGTSAICSLLNHYIKFPRTRQHIDRVKTDFYNIARFPKVLGAIDCTHVRITAPTVNEPDFVNRKGYHSINVQMVCDGRFMVSNLVARWPGSVHDSRIFRLSALANLLENHGVDGLVIGDSGYPCREYLLTPYPHPQTPVQERYNDALTKTRVLIENTFGIMKRRFPCLSYGLRLKPEVACRVITACTILHNVGIARGDTLPRQIEVNADHPEEEMPAVLQNNVRFRDVFAETFFQL